MITSTAEYLTKQVRSLVPYLLRYVFYRHHTHYVNLKKPWKYFATQVWTAKYVVFCPPRIAFWTVGT